MISSAINHTQKRAPNVAPPRFQIISIGKRWQSNLVEDVPWQSTFCLCCCCSLFYGTICTVQLVPIRKKATEASATINCATRLGTLQAKQTSRLVMKIIDINILIVSIVIWISNKSNRRERKKKTIFFQLFFPRLKIEN